jgi:5'-nucleotidase
MRKIRCLFTIPILFLAACVTVDDTASEHVLTFIHLNDTYRVDAVEDGTRGGFGRVATIVRDLAAQGNDVRILHGGDFLYPSLESQLWDGEQMVEAMNFLDALAPMYVVPGNHELDPRAPERLIKRLQESDFDWLADNMRFATGDEIANKTLQRAFTFMAGEQKIGVFALALHPDDGGNLRDYAPVFDGYTEIAEIVIRELEAGGAELIIGLTHLHFADDIEVAKLKAKHPTFMFVAGGHDHEPQFQAGDSQNATIVKGASNARTIWQIDVRFKDGVPQLMTKQIEVDESIVADDQYQLIADKWRTRLLELMPFLSSKIGEAAIRLDAREETVRSRESSWGNFIADQMRTAFRDPPADFAIMNSGSLRIDDYIAEDITIEDIARTFGFSSFLRHMTMRGDDFQTLLEAGFRGSGRSSQGYFPQVAGFRVCVDYGRPDGDRIVQLHASLDDGGWQEIGAERDYILIVPDFLYRGGDGYDFSQATGVSRPGSELGYLVLDAVARAHAAGKEIGVPVDADNPRIAFLAAGQEQCFE